MARRFGGKTVVIVGMLVLSVSTLFIPVAARTHPYIVVALRIVCGLASVSCFNFYCVQSS